MHYISFVVFLLIFGSWCILPSELLFLKLRCYTFDNETSGFIQFQIIFHHIKITLMGLKSRTNHVSSGQIIGQIIINNEIPVYSDRYIGHEIEKIGALYRFHRGINQNKLGTCLKGRFPNEASVGYDLKSDISSNRTQIQSNYGKTSNIFEDIKSTSRCALSLLFSWRKLNTTQRGRSERWI